MDSLRPVCENKLLGIKGGCAKDEGGAKVGTTKLIDIRYFAILREQAGTSEELLKTAARDARELYGELKAKHGFTLDCERLMVAINNEYQSWDTGLEEGDSVVFIPPVAGG